MEEEKNQEASSHSNFFVFCSRFDIFSFLPVPIGREVSSKRSILASMILLIFFISYVAYCIYVFVTNNPPRTNQYFMPIPESLEIESPQFAVVFMTGENLNISFYDESYFNFKLQQAIIYKDINKKREYIDIPLTKCTSTQIKWLGNHNFQNLWCPEKKYHPKMQGLIYSSEIHKFPRIVVSACVNETNTTNSTIKSPVCASESQINELFSKGRLFFFVSKPGGINFATEKHSPEAFTLLYYFLVPGFYNRAELSIRKNTYIVRPDYLTSFLTKKFSTLTHVGEKIYMSKTPNPSLIFLIWMKLDQSEEYNDIVFITLIDNISLWGALWGVMFSLFAFYFLKHNRKRFYEKKPDWNEFDEEFEKIKRKKEKEKKEKEKESLSESEEEEKTNLREKERKFV